MFRFTDEKVQSFICTSPAETVQLGEVFGEALKGGEVIAYTGGMGMGKTTFTTGLVKGIGSDADVSSPTFAILNEYRGGRFPLCHIDAFRLHGGEELESIGFYDYLDKGWGIAVEWSEQLCGYLTEVDYRITFERISDNQRRITFYRV